MLPLGSPKSIAEARDWVYSDLVKFNKARLQLSRAQLRDPQTRQEKGNL